MSIATSNPHAVKLRLLPPFRLPDESANLLEYFWLEAIHIVTGVDVLSLSIDYDPFEMSYITSVYGGVPEAQDLYMALLRIVGEEAYYDNEALIEQILLWKQTALYEICESLKIQLELTLLTSQQFSPRAAFDPQLEDTKAESVQSEDEVCTYTYDAHMDEILASPTLSPGTLPTLEEFGIPVDLSFDPEEDDQTTT